MAGVAWGEIIQQRKSFRSNDTNLWDIQVNLTSIFLKKDQKQCILYNSIDMMFKRQVKLIHDDRGQNSGFPWRESLLRGTQGCALGCWNVLPFYLGGGDTDIHICKNPLSSTITGLWQSGCLKGTKGRWRTIWGSWSGQRAFPHIHGDPSSESRCSRWIVGLIQRIHDGAIYAIFQNGEEDARGRGHRRIYRSVASQPRGLKKSKKRRVEQEQHICHLYKYRVIISSYMPETHIMLYVDDISI